jgi:hypothetical protein
MGTCARQVLPDLGDVNLAIHSRRWAIPEDARRVEDRATVPAYPPSVRKAVTTLAAAAGSKGSCLATT